MNSLLFFMFVRLCSGQNSIVNWDRTVREKEYPFIVSVQKLEQRLSNFYHFCGGTIVSSTYIMTAGHCVINLRLLANFRNRQIVPEHRGNFRILAGVVNLTDAAKGQIRRVRKIKLPENVVFNRITGQIEDDLGLVEIYERFVFNDYVAPARFVTSKGMDHTEELYMKYARGRLIDRCKVAGWGSENITYDKFRRIWIPTRPSDKLRVVTVRIFRHAICDLFFCSVNKEHCGRYNFSWEGIFCGKGTKEFSDPCDGDSGSPIFCDGLVYGLMAFVENEWGCGRGAPSCYVSGVTMYNFLVYELYSRSKGIVNLIKNTFLIASLLSTIKA